MLLVFFVFYNLFEGFILALFDFPWVPWRLFVLSFGVFPFLLFLWVFWDLGFSHHPPNCVSMGVLWVLIWFCGSFGRVF